MFVVGFKPIVQRATAPNTIYQSAIKRQEISIPYGEPGVIEE